MSSAPASPPQSSAASSAPPAPELSPEEEQWLQAQLADQVDEADLVAMTAVAGLDDAGFDAEACMSAEEMDEFERWLDSEAAKSKESQKTTECRRAS